ncbi:MAG: hypothetical protein COU42_01705 [Candidatus Nealsonbacteria bacterium CG10_big_fil_rev_8_21_14_0_10_36_24]|uniref:AbiEi antitoxin C-terminal domain-containing protein n=2 Tax=Candidatus Nealsoniibacteriota TaxID=1817911 RepID=A0A2H0YQ22_9BACT|nr:MAG: hypothetical protein COU42_01705 [Candidatus Nealsonbacteria bacterium CG10_big_fil_rev_8_21_14_0_10_36_24]PIS40369.1 MAG: hypothetical protein COT32_00080 [Candidatus Nealsonbacteria bacterium CG08_land_8_20_14_0_20_36_22]
MRNNLKPQIKKIISLVRELPYFSFEDLSPIEKNKDYLKILLSRYENGGKVVRLKKGSYVVSEFIDKIKAKGEFSSYLEFLANILYQPSYLSLDYILYRHNILTELPVNFTSIAKNKTAIFSNKLGSFIYRKVKDDLFCGFKIKEEGGFSIAKATKAKALFDFIYLRKNALTDKKAIEELRLNLDDFAEKDIKEVELYVKIEKSKKMKEIFKNIFRK